MLFFWYQIFVTSIRMLTTHGHLREPFVFHFIFSLLLASLIHKLVVYSYNTMFCNLMFIVVVIDNIAWHLICCRRYTKFYGTSERAASNLVHDALTSMYLWSASVCYLSIMVNVIKLWKLNVYYMTWCFFLRLIRLYAMGRRDWEMAKSYPQRWQATGMVKQWLSYRD